MVLVLGTLLAMGAIVYVAYPFFHRKHTRGPSLRLQKLNDLLLRKEALYASIRDLDFDYRMGKLAQEEHQRLVNECKKEAAAVLTAIDRLDGKSDIVEPEVATRRQKVKVNKQISDGIFCANCGAQQRMTDTFCANCGQKLRK